MHCLAERQNQEEDEKRRSHGRNKELIPSPPGKLKNMLN
jgi:hypothetical protein